MATAPAPASSRSSSERNPADLGAAASAAWSISAPTATSVQIARGRGLAVRLQARRGELEAHRCDCHVPGLAGPRYAVDLAAGNPSRRQASSMAYAPRRHRAKTSRSPRPPRHAGYERIHHRCDQRRQPRQPSGRADRSARHARRTSLAAASAVAAGKDFFKVGAVKAPRRIAGPPFGTATSLVAGTATDTVTWYTGEDGAIPSALPPSPGRRRDRGGLRPGADEQGIRWVVQNAAVLAAVTLRAGRSGAGARNVALNYRMATRSTGRPALR